MTLPGTEPEILEYRLPGAVELAVYPTRRFKTSVVHLLFLRPLDEDTPPAALLPFVLRRGTRRDPDMAALSRRLERMFGAGLDVDVSRFGEQQILSFRLDVVDDRYLLLGGADLLYRGLEILREVLLEPCLTDGEFPRERVDQERLNLRRYVEGLADDRARYAFDRCVRHMCAGEPYARCEYGEPEEIDRVSGEDLLAIRRQILHTAPLRILVVGSGEPSAIREAVADLFGGIRDGAGLRHPGRASRRRPRRVSRIRETGPVVQSRLVMGYRTPIGHGDRLSFPLVVMNSIFGGAPFSRLFREVRERRSLAYYCSSSVDQAKGVAFVQAGIDGENAPRVERIVRRQLADLKAGRIEEEEFRAAKAALRAGLLAVRDSPGRIAGFLGEQWLASGPRSFSEVMAAIRRVRRRDVAAAAQSLRLDTVYLLTNGVA